MDTVQSILNQFSSTEKEQLFRIASSRNSPNSKKLKLFQLFLDQPKNCDSYYSQKIYGEADKKAFPQLKKRLKDEIEEIMVLVKPSKLSDKCQHRIQCLELILQSQLILSRGLKSEGAKLLEKCLKSAVDFQFHDLVLTIFSIARDNDIPEVLSKNDFPKIEFAVKSHLQILINQFQNEAIEVQSESKNELLSKLVHQINSNKDHWSLVNSIRNSILDDNLEEGLSIINGVEPQEIFKEENPAVFWQFLLAKMELLILQKNYEEVRQICQDHLKSPKRSLETPIEFFQFYFFANFYLGKWDQAQRIINSFLRPQFPDQNWKWQYWSALIKLEQKEYCQAIKLLHTSQSGLKKSTQYYLASKLYEILILIEQGDHDWLEYKIENFRKLLSRWKEVADQRIKSSFDAICKLYGSGGKTSLQINTEFEKIHSLEKSNPWCPFGFEIIRLDNWIISRQFS